MKDASLSKLNWTSQPHAAKSNEKSVRGFPSPLRKQLNERVRDSWLSDAKLNGQFLKSAGIRDIRLKSENRNHNSRIFRDKQVKKNDKTPARRSARDTNCIINSWRHTIIAAQLAISGVSVQRQNLSLTNNLERLIYVVRFERYLILVLTVYLWMYFCSAALCCLLCLAALQWTN